MAKRETRNEGEGVGEGARTLRQRSGERERERKREDFSRVRAGWGEEVGRLKPASVERTWADAPSSAKYRAAVATAMAASTCARFVKFRERERERERERVYERKPRGQVAKRTLSKLKRDTFVGNFLSVGSQRRTREAIRSSFSSVVLVVVALFLVVRSSPLDVRRTFVLLLYFAFLVS